MKEFSKLSSILTKVVEIQTILNNLRWHLTVFPSNFNNIYPKYFCILQNLTRNYKILWKLMKVDMKVYESLWKLMKVDESYDIPRYFFGQIPCFCSVLFACNVLFAFRNFVLWWTKFSCLLLYRIASRQYRQIFHHCQKIGDISNIADTYWQLVEYLTMSQVPAWLISTAKIGLGSRFWESKNGLAYYTEVYDVLNHRSLGIHVGEMAIGWKRYKTFYAVIDEFLR